ncbi:MAG: EamA family transporter [Pseudolabrys sp.]|nr:EamA family transporter [Pseudolabrys sp.]MBV9259809.1 EamA family transporter [Pseudolabrys sp.]
MQPITINRAMSAREWTLLFVLSVLWGGTFYFVAVAVKELPPLTLAALRVSVGLLTLLLVLLIIGHRLPRSREAWVAFLGMGLLNNAGPFVLLNWGQAHIPSGVASIFLGTTPFFAAILAHVYTHDERLTGGRLFGVIAGMIGIAAMVGASAVHALTSDVAGQLAVMLAAIGYAIAGLWGRRFARLGIGPLIASAGMMIVSSATLVPIALIIDRPWTLPLPSPGALGAVLGLAIPSTALAYVIYFRLLRTVGATNLMLVTFLMPVTAILLGVTFLGEHLEPRHIAGMSLIALGLAAIDGRVWRLLPGK